MKRIGLIVAALAAIFVGLELVSTARAASPFATGEDISVASGQTVDHTYFAAGSTIDIAGTINGDLICAGQSITISGTINGDVLCAGQTVHISGSVNGDVRAAGQSLTLDGIIAHNASLAGQSVVVSGNSYMQGDLMATGQSVTFDGKVGRDMYTAATVLTLNGSVGRDVTSYAQKFDIGAQAVIAGTVEYTSLNNAHVASGAMLGHPLMHHQPPKRDREATAVGVFAGFGFVLYALAAFLLITLVIVLVLPQLVHGAAETAAKEPLKTIIIGLAASILVPIAIIAVMLTVIGIPLGLILGLVWILAHVAAFPLSAYYVGRLLLQDTTTNVMLRVLVGAVLLLVLFLIPFIGFLAWLATMWFGLGALVLQGAQLPRPNYEIQPKKR